MMHLLSTLAWLACACNISVSCTCRPGTCTKWTLPHQGELTRVLWDVCSAFFFQISWAPPSCITQDLVQFSQNLGKRWDLLWSKIALSGKAEATSKGLCDLGKFVNHCLWPCCEILLLDYCTQGLVHCVLWLLAVLRKLCRAAHMDQFFRMEAVCTHQRSRHLLSSPH